MNKELPTIDIKKYGGKQVAVVDGEVVASGKTAKEVLKIAKKENPRVDTKNIKILAVPKTTASIYCV